MVTRIEIKYDALFLYILSKVYYTTEYFRFLWELRTKWVLYLFYKSVLAYLAHLESSSIRNVQEISRNDSYNIWRNAAPGFEVDVILIWQPMK